MTKTLECVECGASAPYGRLSCPSCGALLASVTGGRRSAVRVTQVESSPEPTSALSRSRRLPPPPSRGLREPATNGPGGARRKRARASVPAPRPSAGRAPSEPRSATPAPSGRRDRTDPAPGRAQPRSRPRRPPPAGRRRPPAPAAGPHRSRGPDPELRADSRRPGAERCLDADHRPPLPSPGKRLRPRPRSPPKTPRHPQPRSRPPSDAPSQRRFPPRSGPRAGPRATHRPPPAALRARTSAPAAPARSQTQAGRVEAERAAIVPLLEPSAIASLPATPWAPIEEPAPALKVARISDISPPSSTRSTVAPPPSAYRPPSQAVHHGDRDSSGERSGSSIRPPMFGRRRRRGTIPKELTLVARQRPRPGTLRRDRRLVHRRRRHDGAARVPAAMVAGRHRRAHVGGYFDGWGLASPTHLFVFVGLLAVLALAIRRTRPGLDLVGDLGFVFGGLLLGLAWPYLVGPLGADVGLTMTTLGGVALWSVASSRCGRHVTSWLNRSSEGTAAERRLRTAPATLRRARQTEPDPPSPSG